MKLDRLRKVTEVISNFYRDTLDFYQIFYEQNIVERNVHRKPRKYPAAKPEHKTNPHSW